MASCLAVGSILLCAPPSLAADPPTSGGAAPPTPVGAIQPEAAAEFDETLVLDSGRRQHPKPKAEALSFSIRGEYQLRYRAATDLPLTAPIGKPAETKLGQNHYLYHWLRLTPRFQYRDVLTIVGQIDVPRGMIVGDSTRDVTAVRDAYEAPNWIEVHPRYLYLEWASPIGTFRIGQQGSHWGMGILANDGDHPTMFGDYLRGALVERILFATTPLGKDTPLVVAAAGDVVLEDNTADLLGDDIHISPRNGDVAFQGVLALSYRTKPLELGIYGVYRNQHRGTRATGPLRPFTEELEVGVLDVAAKLNRPLPGGGGFVYASAEAAFIFGDSTYLRGAFRNDIAPKPTLKPEVIQSFGAAATVGVVREKRAGRDRWGDVAAEIEWGYATGDANPMDGVSRRFTIDQNHNVGLVLFDHVMAWKTARAATLAQDPQIVARPTPGADFLPSRGGIFGATYVNPRIVVRPKPFIDLKAGVVIAQTTADFVDPFRAGALGDFRNYDGGDARRHDLGVELDGGATFRIAFPQGTTLELGAEGGVLFPGHAFDDAQGKSMDAQAILNTKAGVLY